MPAEGREPKPRFTLLPFLCTACPPVLICGRGKNPGDRRIMNQTLVKGGRLFTLRRRKQIVRTMCEIHVSRPADQVHFGWSRRRG